MSGSLRIVAELPLIEVTSAVGARKEYLGGVPGVDFYGPASLMVSDAARERELASLVRAVRVAWDGQVRRNEAIISALRSAADHIEKAGDAAEVLMPMLLSALTQAVEGRR